MNFVDVARFDKKPIGGFRKAIAPNGENIILHASNFRKIKRVEDVIKVFALVKHKKPTKLLLIGDGPERNNIEVLCRDLNVQDEVVFVGKQEQMEDILPIADVFLLTSEYESFGLAALEAMAASVPVVSTNAGGLPEINVDGLTGYLSNIGDVNAMSEQVLAIIKDEATLKGFRERAFNHAKQFDIHHIVPQYEELYQKFL
jgi:N-acetyl-alpha-D-glucosaminyl L-malate synthase BshA